MNIKPGRKSLNVTTKRIQSFLFKTICFVQRATSDVEFTELKLYITPSFFVIYLFFSFVSIFKSPLDNKMTSPNENIGALMEMRTEETKLCCHYPYNGWNSDLITSPGGGPAGGSRH